MKIKQGFELRDVCGEKIVQAVGVEHVDYTRIIDLNETAAYLFEQLAGREFSIDDMVAALEAEYDVDADRARHDCAILVERWKEAGIVELEE